jgi:diguanylate cyclase (GGDEF)-like protein/PAS domain S-box-containing protein
VLGTPAWIAVLACAGVAAGAAADAVHVGPLPTPLELVLLFVALLVAGSLTVEVRHRGEIESFDVFEVAIAPTILLVGGLRAVLLVGAAKALAQLLLRMPVRKLAFNVTQWMACAGVGALTFALLGGHSDARLALAVAMVVVAVVNLAAVAGLFWMLGGWAAARQLLLPAELAWTAGLTAVTVVTGVAAAAGAVGRPEVLLLVIALAALLHWAGRGYALARADLVTTQNLHSATRALTAIPDVRATPEAFLAEVVRCCSARAAELALERNGRLVVHRYDAEPEGGEPDGAEPDGAGGRPAGAAGPDPHRAISRLLLAHGGPLHAVAGDGEFGAALVAAGRRDCLAAPVRSGDDMVGVLAVYDRSGFTDQDRSDETILGSLAREVGAAVQRAELVEEIVAIRQDAARIVDTTLDGIAALAEDGSVVTWNHAFATLTGYPPEKVIGGIGLAVLDVRDGDGTPVRLEHWPSGAALPPDLVVRTVDGQRRWLSCTYARATRDAGNGPLLVVMARDVTDLRVQDRLIAEQARILELVASDAPVSRSLDTIAALVQSLTDAAAAVLLAGPPPAGGFQVAVPPGDTDVPAWMHRLPDELFAVTLDGWRWAEAVGEPVVLAGEDIHVGREGGWADSRNDGRAGGWADGTAESPCWAWPVLDADRAVVRAVIALWPPPGVAADARVGRVLTSAGRLAGLALDRDAAHVRLTFQATHDPLTGLPNRRLFLEQCGRSLEAAAVSGRYAVVLFVDLDRFKVINDSLGHDAGDRLLVAVGERLRPVVRPADTLARFGGDEFTILCEEVRSEKDARVLAERVLALFAAPFHIDGREVFETASVGIALGRSPTRAEDLVQHADAAMYRAKARGGNRAEFFDAVLRREAEDRLSDYAALRRAVNGAEFVVHYQPTFALGDGAPVGMEALARWRHPARGLLGPDVFMDLAEETGLIVPLGEQVLRTVLRELRTSKSALRVAVNLSARQLTQPNLAATVADALDAEGIPPDRLSLEITESVLLSDSETIQRVIAQLKMIGVDLSLDDFGTGHSSMDYLKFLPVDELKIERRFVAGLLTDHRDRAIVSAITQLGHDLGLRVVAEGIETQEQFELLRELRCDVGQGYYFGRPRPLKETLGLPE